MKHHMYFSSSRWRRTVKRNWEEIKMVLLEILASGKEEEVIVRPRKEGPG